MITICDIGSDLQSMCFDPLQIQYSPNGKTMMLIKGFIKKEK